jgi:hypothetical protein
MLALATLTYGGIPKKNYEPLKREMLHAYGGAVGLHSLPGVRLVTWIIPAVIN